MSYQRLNVYKAECVKRLMADCQVVGPDSSSIERCFSNACEDGWKQIADRQVICPQCLAHMQNNGRKLLS